MTRIAEPTITLAEFAPLGAVRDVHLVRQRTRTGAGGLNENFQLFRRGYLTGNGRLSE